MPERRAEGTETEIILPGASFHSIQKRGEIDQLRARVQKIEIKHFVASHRSNAFGNQRAGP